MTDKKPISEIPATPVNSGPLITQQGTDPWLPPCFIEGLPEAQYFAIDAVSSSYLKTLVDQSPLHAKEAPHKETKAMNLGSVAHKLLLEPGNVQRDILVKPAGAGKASNAAKAVLLEWLCESVDEDPSPVTDEKATGKILDRQIAEMEPKLDALGKLVCDKSTFDKACLMRDNVLAKSIGKVLFNAGKPELTVLAVDPHTGILCRGRLDWVPDGHDVICDLKTTASAAFDEFARSAGSYRYHVQASFYQALESFFGQKLRKEFLHVVIENEPPYDCAFYQIDKEALDHGRQFWQRGLDLELLCRKIGKWPGLGWDWGAADYDIEVLSIPKWGLK